MLDGGWLTFGASGAVLEVTFAGSGVDILTVGVGEAGARAGGRWWWWWWFWAKGKPVLSRRDSNVFWVCSAEHLLTEVCSHRQEDVLLHAHKALTPCIGLGYSASFL